MSNNTWVFYYNSQAYSADRYYSIYYTYPISATSFTDFGTAISTYTYYNGTWIRDGSGSSGGGILSQFSFYIVDSNMVTWVSYGNGWYFLSTDDQQPFLGKSYLNYYDTYPTYGYGILL